MSKLILHLSLYSLPTERVLMGQFTDLLSLQRFLTYAHFVIDRKIGFLAANKEKTQRQN